jgi:hypothetical protein
MAIGLKPVYCGALVVHDLKVVATSREQRLCIVRFNLSVRVKASNYFFCIFVG